MAKCATVAPAQTEAAVLAIGTAETACEGRLYPTSDTNKVYIGMANGTLVGPLPGSSGGGGNFVVPGPYADDAAAAAGGVAVGNMYRISAGNDRGIPSPEGRTVVVRIS